ncbi:hypothetical protein PInf_017432 [Phytophthora infestans]|nr:hypothetical protein PInf_017432 [Phytophthora infestans]
MSNLMSRSRFPFDMGSEMLAAPSNVDDDEFFRDLPVLLREQRPATQHREVATQPTEKETDSVAHDPTLTRDNDPNKQTVKAKVTTSTKASNKKQKQQSDNSDSSNVDADSQYRRAFSSYTFSNSSIVDDKGQLVTSSRRRYEDSTGRLKAVHERQIEGKKLRTTWNRMHPDDEGQHEAICSSGTPDEFETLWQQTPFGETQKKTIKDQHLLKLMMLTRSSICFMGGRDTCIEYAKLHLLHGSTWDLVRPRFWYPMSSLEQSMMDLEHMSNLMSRSRFPFDMGSEMLAAPSNVDDDEFFRDLPVLLREQRPATQHREVATQPTEKETDNVAHDPTPTRDNDPNKQTVKAKATTSTKASNKEQKRQSDNSDSSNVDADSQYRRAFSSYTFSNSSIVDDKGRRVTSSRRRYEDSTGRLKAVHERQIEGKKLRTTWNRMHPDDAGQHEAICSSGTPDEFETMWQQRPFGEAQKKTIKDQQRQQQLQPGQQTRTLQQQQPSESEAEKEATPMEE